MGRNAKAMNDSRYHKRGMTLNRRYMRNIRENLAFYIAAIVLTIVSLLLFFLFYIAGTGIMNYGDAFFERNNVEDATFTTYQEIPDDEIENIEKKYNVSFEKEHFTNINEDDYKVRVFEANEKIDLYEVIDGKDVSKDNEIVISKGYAVNEKVKIGDKVKIAGKSYKVTGYFLRPDYLYMLENPDDSYKNISTFFLAYMTDNAYEELGAQSCQYKVVYEKGCDQSKFRKAMNDEYMMSSYLAKGDNTRITMVDDQAQMFIIMAIVFLFVIPLITVALISIIIGRKVKNEQKMIGTLSALGYTKGRLMWHYSVLAMIPGLIGGVLVSILTKCIQQPYGELSLADYEPMPVKFTLPIPIALVGIIVPTALYMLAAAKKVNKLLKKDTVTLLSGNVDADVKTRHVMVGKSVKVRTKFAVRSILANPGRSFVVFLGAFLGAMIISIAFLFIDSINNVVDSGSNSMGDFKYEYTLNTLVSDEEALDMALNEGNVEDKSDQQESSVEHKSDQQESGVEDNSDSKDMTAESTTAGIATIESSKVDGADKIVMAKYEYDGSAFTVLGADSDVKLLNIETTDGKTADLDSGFYITNIMAYAYNLKAGDKFTFVNPTTMEEKSIKIKGIISNDSQKLVIGSREAVWEMAGLSKGTYNGLLSEKALDLGDKISKTVTADDIKEQMKTILDEMGAIIYSLAIIGAIICIASLYVSVNMLVTENRHNISMLKVLGLTDREINRMVLDVNHVLIPIGIAAGMAVGYLSMVIVFRIYSGMEGVKYSAVISAKSIVLTVVITLACYVVSLLIVRKKADNVDMVESLKDNRE
ncbi:ABC transporter permease [Agathobacter sp.]